MRSPALFGTGPSYTEQISEMESEGGEDDDEEEGGKKKKKKKSGGEKEKVGGQSIFSLSQFRRMNPFFTRGPPISGPVRALIEINYHI